MPAPIRQTDSHGFPLPTRFDEPDPIVRRGVGAYHRRIRWIVVSILAVVLVMLIARSPLAKQGRLAMAQYHATRAQQRALADDYNGALSEIDRAIAWSRDTGALHRFRGQLNVEVDDLDQAVVDYSKALELMPSEATAAEVQIRLERSMVYQRLRKVDAALEDLNKAAKRQPQDPRILNARAYARAVFEVEVAEALVDIQQALKASSGAENAAFLDTRGYVYFRLEKYDEALKDIQAAIRQTEEDRQQVLNVLGNRKNDVATRRLLEQFSHDLAVMYHHRGEIYEKQGNKKGAEADLRKADELGFDFDAGVF